MKRVKIPYSLRSAAGNTDGLRLQGRKQGMKTVSSQEWQTRMDCSMDLSL